MLSYSTSKIYQKSQKPAAARFAEDEREKLIVTHLSKVKYIADRIAAKLPPSVEKDDLYGAGVLGLLDAVERYDPSRGVAFTTFAELRVRGAILDNLRSHDWASRTTRRRAKDVQAAYSQLEQTKGRPATEAEVADFMSISINDLHEILTEINGLMVSNLDEQDEKTGLSLLDTICDRSSSPLDQLEESERRNLLIQGIEKLPPRERQIIALYYVEELNMKEIGAVMGVTESRVSQLRTQAIMRLRGTLKK